MDHENLVAAFAQTVGVEKAEALIADAAADLGIERASAYSGHEVADICEIIQRTSDGHVRLVASEVRVRQQAQRRFDALLDEITDPVVTVSFESTEPVVTAVNPAFEATFGYGPEAVGQPLTDLIVPRDCDGHGTGSRDSDAHRDAIARWLHADPDGGFEVECVTASADRRTVLFRPVVVSRENARIEGYGIYTDITERKRRERRLELQNEQLERFASVVSHDLRNPLQVARGRLEAALEENEDESVQPHLEHARSAYEQMADLVEDLLTLARDGQVVESETPVMLGDVVREAWAAVQSPNATLRVDDGDRTVMADRGRLRQLLQNLLRNALEHGSTSPRSSKSHDDAVEHGATDAADAGPSADRDRAVTVRVGVLEDGFFVEDDGPGIPESEREQVFDHGYSTRSEGTGFGLAIVAAIVDAHEWDVAIRESASGGARFEVTGATVS